MTVIPPQSARKPMGLPTAGLASSSAAVFAGPSVDRDFGETELATLSEYTRNDRHLSYRPNRAYSALDAWPEPGIPDINRQRRTTISPNDRTFLFFLPERGHGAGYRSGSSYRRPY